MHSLLTAPPSFSVGYQDKAAGDDTEMSPEGGCHHPHAGAEGQEAPQGHYKSKSGVTTAPAAKQRRWESQAATL